MVRHGSTAEYASISQGREENWKHVMKTKLTKDERSFDRRSLEEVN
jgi:hypothetical protein